MIAVLANHLAGNRIADQSDPPSVAIVGVVSAGMGTHSGGVISGGDPHGTQRTGREGAPGGFFRPRCCENKRKYTVSWFSDRAEARRDER